MDWHAEDTIKRTLESYRVAMGEILAMCPYVYPSLNEGNFGVVAPCSWRPAWGRNTSDLRKWADSVTVTIAELIRMGTEPYPVKEDWHVWRNSFFQVQFQIIRPFHLWGWKAARAGDDGTEHAAVPYEPSEHESRDQTIALHYDGPKYGLKDWFPKAQEIAHVCDDCSDAIREAYAAHFAEACKRVERWDELRRAVPALPLK